MRSTFKVTGLAQAVTEFCRAYDLLSTAGANAIKVMLVAADIDCTNEGEVGKAITPHLAAHYGIKLVKSERVSKFGDKTFPDNGKGKTAANVRTLIVKLVVGERASQRNVPEFTVPAEVMRAAKALRAAEAALLAACKPYEHAGALRKQALAAVK